MQMQQQAMLMMNQMGELQSQIGDKGGKQPAAQVRPNLKVKDTGPHTEGRSIRWTLSPTLWVGV